VRRSPSHCLQITDWKKQLLESAPDIFGKGARKAEDAAETFQKLHAKIGQLTMENDFSYGGTSLHKSGQRWLGVVRYALTQSLYLAAEKHPWFSVSLMLTEYGVVS
jgi:hypothetical protein